MTNIELVRDIGIAFGVDENISKVYGLNNEWFDNNPNELMKLFKLMIGNLRGELAYKIYESKIKA